MSWKKIRIIEFAEILDRVAVGDFSNEDFLTLYHRWLNIFNISINEAILIFPTNEAVNNINEKCLRKLNKLVSNNQTIDNPSFVNNIDNYRIGS